MAPSWMPSLEGRATSPDHMKQNEAGHIVQVILSLSSMAVITSFLTQRMLNIKVWKHIPYVVWLVFIIYVDSACFIFATAVLSFGLGVNASAGTCDGAILLCLVCYVSTKLIYLFLVEKAFIIRGYKKGRMKSKLYIFNSFGMMGVYAVVVILNFTFRISRLEDGQCVIGMQRFAMVPLIAFDLVVNIYLTILFLIPLYSLYSFKNVAHTPFNVRLRTVAIRTTIGAICTLLSSIVNLTVLTALDGEPGWVCLMCCNSDILFSAIVIQWVTSKDNAASTSSKADPSVYSNAHARSQPRHRHTNSRGTANSDPYTMAAANGADITDVDTQRSSLRLSFSRYGVTMPSPVLVGERGKPLSDNITELELGLALDGKMDEAGRSMSAAESSSMERGEVVHGAPRKEVENEDDIADRGEKREKATSPGDGTSGGEVFALGSRVGANGFRELRGD